MAELDGVIVAMFVIRPNHPGPASHVANASYAVDIVGTIPGGFRMPDDALVDHHIMHRNLRRGAATLSGG